MRPNPRDPIRIHHQARRPPELPELRPVLKQGNQEITTTSANFFSRIEANGADTTYHFEYSTSESVVKEGKGTPVAAIPPGPIVAEPFETAAGFGEPQVHLEGLTPGTTYYLRVVAGNEKGETTETLDEFGHDVQIARFTTVTGKPRLSGLDPTSISATSLALHTTVIPDNSETHWRIEYSTSESGPWSVGASGTIAAAEADEQHHNVVAGISGLQAATVYYFRAVAENSCAEGCGTAATPILSLETAGPPRALAFAVHTFAPGASEAIRILGSVTPDTAPIDEVQTVTLGGAPSGGAFTLGFEGQTSAPIAFDAPAAANSGAAGSVEAALSAIPAIGGGAVEVSGPRGGPYRVEFRQSMGGTDQPQLSCDASALTPSGTCTVATTQNGSTPLHTHYHLEYLTQQQFERNQEEGKEGFAGAEQTPQLDAGVGGIQRESATFFAYSPVFTAADLPALTPGATYRYRLLAANENGAATSPEQTLTVPATPQPEAESCPNEALRTGPSAHLPDCRAYEQVTPVDKGGTSEIVKYGFAKVTADTVGEDGEHFLFGTPLSKFGANPDSNDSNYLFSRQAGKGWPMTSASPQPEAGANSYTVRLHSSDLTKVALEIGWDTLANRSTEVTLEAGPFGGPYATVASMPRSKVPGEASQGSKEATAWVAASADFSKLVLWTEYRKLIEGHNTHTTSGADLYEYSAGELRQANVDSEGKTIGACGARVVTGAESAGTGTFTAQTSSPHALSADGSRLFFEAVPTGSACSAPRHLYMRVHGGEAGAETVDIGAYRFLAADAQGARLLILNGAGEVSLYDTEARTAKPLLTGGSSPQPLVVKENEIVNQRALVSADLTTIYFGSLNRYDVPTETLHPALPMGLGGKSGDSEGTSVSPDGRYFYWTSLGPPGVPGGYGEQAYRYDSLENVVQCIACASPFNPEPKFESTFFKSLQTGTGMPINGVPNTALASANGDYVFFDTPAALLPSDVNGEIAPEGAAFFHSEHGSSSYSPSSDVYEWRKPGVDGCAHAQGCLALISSGQGGFMVMLLGTTPSGRDVFFTTTSQLVTPDTDTAADVYDARLGGGQPPPPPRPVECEGDACSTPAPAPNDPTPSSSTYSGPGNEHPRHHKHHKKRHHKKAHKRHANNHRRVGK